MSLLIRTHFDLAKSTLKRSRGRSFLTCLGIAIGVASIILILSLMGSINRLIAAQVKSVGEDLIVVRPTTHKDSVDNVIDELTSSTQYSKSNLTVEDVDYIKNLNPTNLATAEFPVTKAAPISNNIYTLVGERTVDSGVVLGTNSDLAEILNLELKSGTFINEKSQNTAVIGHDLSLMLYGTTEPIGKTFTLQNEKFIIVGILSESDDPINFNNVDLDSSIIVNINHLREIDPSIQVQQIDVKVATVESVERTANQIKDVLTTTKNGDKNFSVEYGENITHPASNLFNIVSTMLTIVAGISLVVGGIGVMNIMLVSVAERTHEIGIRKSVGATNGNIFGEFIFESLILCLLGGFLGVILGYIGAFFVSVVTPFTPYIDLKICFAALIIPTIVGTIFGLYPAIKAARRNPIDSLKYYN